MSNLPMPWDDSRPSSRELARAAKAQRRTELEIFDYHLTARRNAEFQRIDSQALSDVVRCSAEEVLSNLEWGLERANGRPAALEIVARKIALQDRLDNARIMRRYGG